MVNKWHLLNSDFSIQTLELTPTFKLKRGYVLEKYKNIIDNMYMPAKL